MMLFVRYNYNCMEHSADKMYLYNTLNYTVDCNNYIFPWNLKTIYPFCFLLNYLNELQLSTAMEVEIFDTQYDRKKKIDQRKIKPSVQNYFWQLDTFHYSYSPFFLPPIVWINQQ